MGRARDLARIIADSSGAIAAVNLSNAPNPILPGTIAYLGMSSAPTGWLKANGAAISRATYSSLFAAIGTTFGSGDGSTTFNLPDLRGEFPRGWDDGRGIDSGRSFGSAQSDSMQGHRHKVGRTNASGGPSGSMANGDIYISGSGGGDYGIAETGRTANYNLVGAEIVANETHGTPRQSAETRARNIALLACIKF